MKDQDTKIVRLFASYAMYVNTGLDPKNVDQSYFFSLLYAEHAVISSIGRSFGISPETVHETLRKKIDRFRKLDAVKLTLEGIKHDDLDGINGMCTVQWRLEYRATGNRRKYLEYPVIYIIHLTGEGDERQVIIAELEAGLQAAMIDNDLGYNR